MEQTFTYKPKFGFSKIVWGVVAPIVLIAWPNLERFDLAIGNFTIIPYPWTIYVFGLVGIIMFIMFVSKSLKELKLMKGAAGTLTVSGGNVTYTDVVKGQVVDMTCCLNDVERVKFDEEDGELVATTSDGKEHTFDKSYFANEGDFNTFKALFDKE